MKSESETPQTSGTELVVAEAVRPVKEMAGTTQLDELARIIRESYSKSRKAFEEFNNMRFRVGMAMVFARELIANGNVGVSKNPNGVNQYREDKMDTCPIYPSKKDAKANFTTDSVGLMSWAKKEFPEIPYRTLSRYREWAEFQGLPKVLAHRQQLELPVDTLMPQQILALPGVKQEQLSEVLKTAVNGKDLTLTLRAMNEIPEAKDPEQNLKPRTAKAATAKAKTKASELDYLRTKGSHWFKVLKAHLELFHKTEEPLWDTLSDEDKAELKELLKLGHDQMVASEKRKKK